MNTLVKLAAIGMAGVYGKIEEDWRTLRTPAGAAVQGLETLPDDLARKAGKALDMPPEEVLRVWRAVFSIRS